MFILSIVFNLTFHTVGHGTATRISKKMLMWWQGFSSVSSKYNLGLLCM
jgi:hypothetical protein